MNGGKGMLVEQPSNEEIVFTRVLSAPPELVFKAWIDPKHVVNWWGPKGFTNTVKEMDVRPGGVWRVVMHGPDGTDYDTKWMFLEIEKPKRLLYQHGEKGKPGYFRLEVTITEHSGKTTLSVRTLFDSPEACDSWKGMGGLDGLSSSLDRLDEQVMKVEQ